MASEAELTVKKQIRTRTHAGTGWRTIYAGCALLALLAGSSVLITGCSDDVWNKFRSAAFGSIESGLKSIADGVLTGIFTVATPGSNGSSTTTQPAASTGSGG
jgi:hypothetical protein